MAPGQVPDETVFRLGLYYAPILFVIWMLLIASLMLYRIDRDMHEDNLRTLADFTEIASGRQLSCWILPTQLCNYLIKYGYAIVGFFVCRVFLKRGFDLIIFSPI